jgi:hypothetical protein
MAQALVGGARVAAAAPAGAAAGRRGSDADADLDCPICKDFLKDAVVLDCGHSACAQCVSRWFADLLRRGQPPECAFRCEPPTRRVVQNRALRDLVKARRVAAGAGAPAPEGAVVVAAAAAWEAAEPTMDPLVPLDDAHLPFDLDGSLGSADAAAAITLAGARIAGAEGAAGLMQVDMVAGIRAQLTTILLDVVARLDVQQPGADLVATVTLAVGMLGGVTALITSAAAALEVHRLSATSSLARLLRWLRQREQPQHRVDVQPLSLAATAMLAALATQPAAGGAIAQRRVFVRVLRADEELWRGCIDEALNAMERYPRIGQVQGDALAALAALLSPLPGFESYHLLDRGLGLALEALSNHPGSAVVAEHALALLLSALTTQDDAARAGTVKRLSDARRSKREASSGFFWEGFVATLAKVIELLPPAEQWRQQDTVILKNACQLMYWLCTARLRHSSLISTEDYFCMARWSTSSAVERAYVACPASAADLATVYLFACIIAEKIRSDAIQGLHFDGRRSVLRVAAYLRCGKAGAQSSAAPPCGAGRARARARRARARRARAEEAGEARCADGAADVRRPGGAAGGRCDTRERWPRSRAAERRDAARVINLLC